MCTASVRRSPEGAPAAKQGPKGGKRGLTASPNTRGGWRRCRSQERGSQTPSCQHNRPTSSTKPRPNQRAPPRRTGAARALDPWFEVRTASGAKNTPPASLQPAGRHDHRAHAQTKTQPSEPSDLGPMQAGTIGLVHPVGAGTKQETGPHSPAQSTQAPTAPSKKRPPAAPPSPVAAASRAETLRLGLKRLQKAQLAPNRPRTGSCPARTRHGQRCCVGPGCCCYWRVSMVCEYGE